MGPVESDCAAVSDVKATPAPPPPCDSNGDGVNGGPDCNDPVVEVSGQAACCCYHNPGSWQYFCTTAEHCHFHGDTCRAESKCGGGSCPEDSGGVSTMIVVVVVVVGLLLIVGAKVILGRRQKVGMSGGCDIDLIKLLSNINTKPLRTRVAPELFCVSMFHRLYEETDCTANPLPM